MTQMPRISLCGRKADKRMFRWHAPSISDVLSTRPRPTRESEAPEPAPVPVISCLGLWRLARRSLARWWRRLWAYQPNVLRLRWREAWVFEVLLAYQKTCPSALKAFISILMSPRLRQHRNNCADCERKQNSIAW